MKRPDFDRMTKEEECQLRTYIRRVLNREKQALEQTKTELEVKK